MCSCPVYVHVLFILNFFVLQVACTWENVREMCDISDSYTSSPAVQFRNKLLHAILDLQEALNMSDLGLLHPVPYKDTHGAIVFAITQYLKVREGGKGEREERREGGEGKREGEKEGRKGG